MDSGELSKVLALSISLVVAQLALWLLTRHERARPPRALLAGYPPSEFPQRERLTGPLAALCASQAGLLALYRELPAKHPARASLLVFLEELRALMDGAYALAALSASPAARERLERLASGAASAVQDMTDATARQLSDGHGPQGDGELELRVDVMRALARDVE